MDTQAEAVNFMKVSLKVVDILLRMDKKCIEYPGEKRYDLETSVDLSTETAGLCTHQRPGFNQKTQKFYLQKSQNLPKPYTNFSGTAPANDFCSGPELGLSY